MKETASNATTVRIRIELNSVNLEEEIEVNNPWKGRGVVANCRVRAKLDLPRTPTFVVSLATASYSFAKIVWGFDLTPVFQQIYTRLPQNMS